MSLFSKIKLPALILMLALSAAFVTGCGNGGDAPENANEEQADDTPQDNADAADPNSFDNAADDLPVPDEPDNKPIGEKSPVAITWIEPEHVTVPDTPVVSGEGAQPETDEPVDSDGDGIPDEHDHEPVPNLFPVDKCQVEINGSYKKDLATELIAQINTQRQLYGIAPVSRNTSLLACADTRAKEQTYFIGHFRPNGEPFTSVAPEGQVQGECIAVDYRDAEKMVDAWYSVNDSRVQLMNPDYTQVGVSIYEVDDTYFIAAEFAY